MNILYDIDLWESINNLNCNCDVMTDFAPINSMHLFLRTQRMKKQVSQAIHNFHVIYFCLHGSGKIEIDGVPYSVNDGEALGVLPHHAHRRLCTDTDVHYLLLRFIPADPGMIASVFNRVLSLSESTSQLISKMMECYISAIQTPSAITFNDVSLYASLVLNSLLNISRSCQPKSNGLPDRLNKALQMLSDPKNVNLQLRDVAKKLGITAGHLSDIIRDHLGYTPSKLKRAIHIRIAINHLLNTDLSISEIAEKSGFKSIYSFSRFFKHIQQMSPLEFRRKNMGNSFERCPVCGNKVNKKAGTE